MSSGWCACRLVRISVGAQIGWCVYRLVCESVGVASRLVCVYRLLCMLVGVYVGWSVHQLSEREEGGVSDGSGLVQKTRTHHRGCGGNKDIKGFKKHSFVKKSKL